MKKLIFLILPFLLFIFCQCDNLQNIFEIKKPVFSVTNINSTYKVEMSAGANGVIFYTLDGSNPTKSSDRYSDALNLGPGTYIKAIAYCPGGKKSKITELALSSSVTTSPTVSNTDKCMLAPK